MGIKKQPAPAAAAASATPSSKLLIKNVPNTPDVGLELKQILDRVLPLQKTLHFTKDGDVILTFIKPEELKPFLEYVEANPIYLGGNLLQFSIKPLDKEKPAVEKSKQVKVGKGIIF